MNCIMTDGRALLCLRLCVINPPLASTNSFLSSKEYLLYHSSSQFEVSVKQSSEAKPITYKMSSFFPSSKGKSHVGRFFATPTHSGAVRSWPRPKPAETRTRWISATRLGLGYYGRAGQVINVRPPAKLTHGIGAWQGANPGGSVAGMPGRENDVGFRPSPRKVMY